MIISKLEEKYSVKIAEKLTSPEEKLKTLRSTLKSIVAATLLECLKAQVLPRETMESMMDTLADESCPKEKRDTLVTEIAYKLGMPVLMPLTKDLMDLTEIFTSEE